MSKAHDWPPNGCGPIICGINVLLPGAMGVPVPYRITICDPNCVNVPEYENIIPFRVLVAMVKFPITVTYTRMLTVFELDNGTAVANTPCKV